MKKLFLIALIFFSCKKDPGCEDTGSILIDNTSKDKQEVFIETFLSVIVDDGATALINDLPIRTYKVIAANIRTGQSQIFEAPVKECEIFEIKVK